MRCTSRQESIAYQTEEARALGFDVAIEVKLNPVYEGDGHLEGIEQPVNAVEENRIFGLATPSGQVAMLIQNRAAAEQFVVGQCYYVDFTPTD